MPRTFENIPELVMERPEDLEHSRTFSNVLEHSRTFSNILEHPNVRDVLEREAIFLQSVACSRLLELGRHIPNAALDHLLVN